MNIPGKLREDLKRIYGNIDPLNCIEDIQVTEGCGGTELKLTLRVPGSCQRYMPGVYMRSVQAPYNLEQLARQQAMMASLFSPGVPKAPEKEAEAPKKDSIEFVKPEYVLFSGPMTHAFWPDGSKTTVRLAEGQEPDEYAAFCAAVVKKLFEGSTPRAKKFLDSVKVIQNKRVKKKKEEPEAVQPEAVCEVEAPAKAEYLDEECVPMEESV